MNVSEDVGEDSVGVALGNREVIDDYVCMLDSRHSEIF